MGVVEYVIGGVLLLMAVLIIVAVLMQSGKDKNLSGAIAGGADTFFATLIRFPDGISPKRLCLIGASLLWIA